MAPRKPGRLSIHHWNDTVETFKTMPRTSGDDMMSKATDPTGQGREKPPCGYRCLLANVPASAATLTTCTDKCEACLSSFRSEDVQRCSMHGYHAALTDEQVAAKTEYMVEATKNNVQYLRRRLQLYGDTVQKRWSKYPKKKRSAMLLKAMPALYDQRFATTMLMRDIMTQPTPNMQQLRKIRTKRQSGELTMKDMFPHFYENRISFLLHWLDLPTLRDEPSSLLALMHNRSFSPPSDWARFDGDEIGFFFRHFVLETNYNPHCIVVQGPRFGTLVQWSAAEMHRGEIIGYPLRELILEAQKTLSEFLCAMVDELSHSSGAEAAQGSEHWYHLADSAFKEPSASLVRLSDYINVAYSNPPKFDIQRLLEIVESRADAAIDDLWQAQANPLAVRTMLEVVQSTAHHNAMSALEQRSQLMLLMISHLRPYGHWEFMLSIVWRLHKLHKTHASNIRRGRNLPAEYEEMLKLLELMLRRYFDSQVEHLHYLTSLVPDFQHHYRFASVEERRRNPEAQFNKFASSGFTCWEKDKLFWALTQLSDHNDRRHHTPQFYFQIIHYFASLQPQKGDPRLPDFLWKHLSDMTTCHEALTKIWHHKPARLSQAEKINPEAFANVASLETMTLWTFRTTSFDLLKDSWKRLSPFMERFMALPSPSTKGCTDAVQRLWACYHGLTEFWLEAGKILQSDVNAKKHAQNLPECYLDHMCAHETFEYQMEMYADCSMLQFEATNSDIPGQPQKPAVPLPRAENSKAADPLAGLSMIERLQLSSKAAIAPIVQPQSSVQTLWGDTNAPVMSSVHREIKMKTRPAKQDNSAETEAPLGVEPQHAEPTTSTGPTITLSKRASKAIFETMFRTNKVVIGMTKWEHFVAAMIDAGFSATHTGGSCVSFRDERYGKGAITLHKLHPDPTLNYKMLKSHARRLHAQFGWTDETFVLSEN